MRLKTVRIWRRFVWPNQGHNSFVTCFTFFLPCTTNRQFGWRPARRYGPVMWPNPPSMWLARTKIWRSPFCPIANWIALPLLLRLQPTWPSPSVKPANHARSVFLIYIAVLSYLNVFVGRRQASIELHLGTFQRAHHVIDVLIILAHARDVFQCGHSEQIVQLTCVLRVWVSIQTIILQRGAAVSLYVRHQTNPLLRLPHGFAFNRRHS